MNRFDKRVGYAVAIVACTIVLLIRMAHQRHPGRASSPDAVRDRRDGRGLVGRIGAAAFWPRCSAPFLGILFIVPPANSLEIVSIADAVNAAIFVFLGFTISFLCDALHRARRSEAEKQFHTLADTIAQLVWMARPDGYRFWFNQRWYDYSGLTLEQLQGDGWQKVCDTSDLPRVLRSWHAALAKGVPWEETYPLRRHDGQMRWHLARAVPVRDARGDIECWFGTSTDIQDRIEIEQTLKDADLRKNQFLATLAHELRNPLSPISNSLQLWPRVENDKEALEQVRSVIERQLQQLVRLIDDLMDLSRISSGKISLRRRADRPESCHRPSRGDCPAGHRRPLPSADGHDARRPDLYQWRRCAASRRSFPTS